jgi:CubicO group peptidase (beta-lactamase class C family)
VLIRRSRIRTAKADHSKAGLSLRVMTRILIALAIALALSTAPAALPQSASVPESQVDAIFSRWTRETPGCAVGVARAGRPVLQKAYGMADLEHDVPNTAETIFEAGSVSKQFTAAAVLLLARDGKLSLDDPARKYIPELPEYGAPLTIRHMLQHTSGLRDWGEVAAIAGWPRTSRVHTHAHVLEIASRQQSLNFPSGTQYSYSNTGYNLAAVIVARVSGQSFAEFSQERIFTPLGMTRTSWRDDHTRIVKGRAVAYSQTGGGFRINMPFENVHGNGGLLTTVGDLLRWNEHFVTPAIGDAAFVQLQQEPGRFNDGRAHTYAMGLMVRTFRGVPEISHSGSTAGYRAQLSRYPNQQVSVAVLCNGSSGNATQAAASVAGLYLAGAIDASPAPQAGGGRAGGAGRGGGRGGGAAASFTPDPKDLASYVGRYYSDEAEVTYEVALDGADLVIKRRPDAVLRLRPTARDEFASPPGTIRFIRNTAGAVTEISLRGSRVFDLRFTRQ